MSSRPSSGPGFRPISVAVEFPVDTAVARRAVSVDTRDLPTDA